MLRPLARTEIMGVLGQMCCPGVLLIFGTLLLMQGTGGQKKIDAIQAQLVDSYFIEGNDVQEDTDSCSETGIVTCEQTQAEKFKTGSADKNGTDWSKSSTGGLDNDIYVFSVFALILNSHIKSLRPHLKSRFSLRAPSL